MRTAIKFCVSAFCLLPFALSGFQTFDVQEATIANIHAAMRAKQLTCRALVETYLQRIEKFDKQGPALNAIVVTNPERDQRSGRDGSAVRAAAG